MKEKYQSLPFQTGKHRDAIGGEGNMWENIGKLQFNLLIENGLKPESALLDLACGSLRLGIHTIPYLNQGNYYGIDKHSWLIDEGIKHEISSEILKEKQPHFYVDDAFDLCHFNAEFDFIIIQSLFTHLPLSKIELCIKALPEVMNKKTQCFFTFFEITTPEQENKIDEEPYHQPKQFYEKLALKYGLDFEYIGDWNHPRGQKLGKLTLQ